MTSRSPFSPSCGRKLSDVSRRTRIDDSGLAKLPGVTKDQHKRLRDIVKLVEEWREVLGLHHDYELLVRPVAMSPDDDDVYKMAVLTEQAEYGRFWIEVTTWCLDPRWDEYRTAYVIHELGHILVYPYTRLARALVPKRLHESIDKMEETLVTAITNAICRAAGADYLVPN